MTRHDFVETHGASCLAALPLLALACWLPLDSMTVNGDRNYYRNHPQYHMYQHPENPSYEELIAARGGGTSLAGQCCNVAVILDLSKYLRRIVDLDPQQRRARVDRGFGVPGVGRVPQLPGMGPESGAVGTALAVTRGAIDDAAVDIPDVYRHAGKGMDLSGWYDPVIFGIRVDVEYPGPGKALGV